MTDRDFYQKWAGYFGVEVDERNCGTYSTVYFGNDYEKPVLANPLTKDVAKELHADVIQLLSCSGQHVSGSSKLMSHVSVACNRSGDIQAGQFAWRMQEVLDARFAGFAADEALGSVGESWWFEESDEHHSCSYSR